MKKKIIICVSLLLLSVIDAFAQSGSGGTSVPCHPWQIDFGPICSAFDTQPMCFLNLSGACDCFCPDKPGNSVCEDRASQTFDDCVERMEARQDSTPGEVEPADYSICRLQALLYAEINCYNAPAY